MAERRIVFRLPLPGLPRAVFVSDYGFRGGRVMVGDNVVLEGPSREILERGVSATLPGTDRRISVRIDDDIPRLSVDGVEARREDEMTAPSSRAAWIHGFIALGGSAFGFVASYLYVLRANAGGDAWSMRMAWHMAAWHLLLTLTLFPASVWGQRIGIRAVQATSLLFFVIHAGIALSNVNAPPDLAEGFSIALFNAASGLLFLAATCYGQKAFAEMDPVRALAAIAEAKSPGRGPLRRPHESSPLRTS